MPNDVAVDVAHRPIAGPSRAYEPVLVGGPSSWAALATPTEVAHPLPLPLPPSSLSIRDEADIEALRDGWPLVVGRRYGGRRAAEVAPVTTSSRGAAAHGRLRDVRSARSVTSSIRYVPVPQLDYLSESDPDDDGDEQQQAPPARRRRPSLYHDSSTDIVVAAAGDADQEDMLPTGVLDSFVDRFAHDRAVELHRSPPPLPPDERIDDALRAEVQTELAEADAAREEGLVSLRDFLAG